jgi:hypothetical protein
MLIYLDTLNTSRINSANDTMTLTKEMQVRLIDSSCAVRVMTLPAEFASNTPNIKNVSANVLSLYLSFYCTSNVPIPRILTYSGLLFMGRGAVN